MQTAADYDRIRDRQLNAHLDAKYREETADEIEARQRAEEKQAIDAALAEVLDIQKCHRGGTLDYNEAAGVLIEYMPQIVKALCRELEAA